MKEALTVLLLTLTSYNALTQNIFEDEGGETTLNFASNYYFFRFNTSETAIKIGGVFLDKEPFGVKFFKRDWGKFINANLKLSANDGLATLYDGGKFNFGYEFNLKPGLMTQRVVDGKSNFFQIFLDANIGTSSFKIADSTNVDGFNKVKFRPRKITINANYVAKEKWFIGGAFGFKSENNVDELDDGNAVKKYFTSSGLQINKVTEVKVGDYQVKDAIRLDADIAFLPGWFENQIGFTVYERSSFHKMDERYDAGFGIFILPKASDDPEYNSIGGVGFTFRDLSNSQNTDKNLGERGILYLFAGFKLN